MTELRSRGSSAASSVSTIWAVAQSSSAAVTVAGSLRQRKRHSWPRERKEKTRSGAVSQNGVPASSSALWARNSFSSHVPKPRLAERTSPASPARPVSSRNRAACPAISGRRRPAVLTIAAWAIVAARAGCRSRFHGSKRGTRCQAGRRGPRAGAVRRAVFGGRRVRRRRCRPRDAVAWSSPARRPGRAASSSSAVMCPRSAALQATTSSGAIEDSPLRAAVSRYCRRVTASSSSPGAVSEAASAKKARAWCSAGRRSPVPRSVARVIS